MHHVLQAPPRTWPLPQQAARRMKLMKEKAGMVVGIGVIAEVSMWLTDLLEAAGTCDPTGGGRLGMPACRAAAGRRAALLA